MKELDVYPVEDHVKPVFGYIFQKERKLGRRDQNYLIEPSKQIFLYQVTRELGWLMECDDSSRLGETRKPQQPR